MYPCLNHQNGTQFLLFFFFFFFIETLGRVVSIQQISLLTKSQNKKKSFCDLPRRNLISTKNMGFVMDFAENLVLRIMENPEERDRKAREHIYEMHERCKKIKEMWALPIRPYGFWKFERHNAQLRWDPQISQVPGRRDPYDDLLLNHHNNNNNNSSSSSSS